MNWRCSSACAVAAALLAGCAAPPAALPLPLPSDGCSAGAVSRLYLGRDTASASGEVSQAQWQAFVNDAVTPRFPAGFSVLQAHGHWRDASRAPARTVREGTFVLEIVHDDSPATRARIRAIAGDYRLRFAQQAVLVAQWPARWCVYGEPLGR